jgi:methionyl-tRNA synthetase
MNKFYICTAIAYVNGKPHLGHALEFAQADSIARYHRLIGDDTFYLTGTDEHGSKIYKKAEDSGVEIQDFVDENAKVFSDLKTTLNISYDDFIRTSSDKHKAACQKLWLQLEESGDIYKSKYKGLYCVGCEAYLSEKDLDENGNCPNHLKPPETLEEENYFFKLSKYSRQIRQLIETGDLDIKPESRKKEFLNMIGEDGLPDVSFSRPKAVLPWGVTVPTDENQVMYVWCDALTNYISGLGYGFEPESDEAENFEKYWPSNVQLIGKDILRFHAGIWVGMLLSAGLPTPKAIYVHGFVTSEGQKMSKSLGNVVDPLETAEKYGIDALRYYLLREIPTDDDGDFSANRFKEVYNSELANSLGNLVNRVILMTEKYLEGKAPKPTEDDEMQGLIEEILEKYNRGFNNFNIRLAAEAVLDLVSFANKYIDDKKPWVMAKEDEYALSDVLYNLLEILRFIGLMLLPLIPDAATKILDQLGLDAKNAKLEETWGKLKEDQIVKHSSALFPRLEDAA